MKNNLKLVVYTDIQTDNPDLASLKNEIRWTKPKLGNDLKMYRNDKGELIFVNSIDDISKAAEKIKMNLILIHTDNKLLIKSIKFKPILLDSNKTRDKEILRTLTYRSQVNYDPNIITQCIIMSNEELNENDSELLINRLSKEVNKAYGLFFNDIDKLPPDCVSRLDYIVPSMIEPLTADFFSSLYNSINNKSDIEQDKWIMKNAGYLEFKLKRHIHCIKSLSFFKGRHEIELESVLRKERGIDSIHNINNRIMKSHNNMIDTQIKILEESIKNQDETELENLMNQKEELSKEKICCPKCSSDLLICPPKANITNGYLWGEVDSFKVDDENLLIKILERSKSIGDGIINSLFMITNQLEGNYSIDSTLPFIREINFLFNNKEYLISIGKPVNYHLKQDSFKMPIMILEKSDNGLEKEAIYSKCNQYKRYNTYSMIEKLKKDLGDKIVSINQDINKKIIGE